MVNKGYKMTDEHKNKIRLALIGYKRPPKTQEYRDNMSRKMKGRIPWNNGLKGWTNGGSFKKGHHLVKNENNPMWRGLNVGYAGVHSWVKRNKTKPEFCEDCGKVPPRDLANISGEYKRDVNDFEWLCRKCHMTKDGRLAKFIKYRRRK